MKLDHVALQVEIQKRPLNGIVITLKPKFFMQRHLVECNTG
jgi:hypothetical protein